MSKKSPLAKLKAGEAVKAIVIGSAPLRQVSALSSDMQHPHNPNMYRIAWRLTPKGVGHHVPGVQANTARLMWLVQGYAAKTLRQKALRERLYSIPEHCLATSCSAAPKPGPKLCC